MGLEPAYTRQEKKFKSRYHLSQGGLQRLGNMTISLLVKLVIHFAFFNLAFVTSFWALT